MMELLIVATVLALWPREYTFEYARALELGTLYAKGTTLSGRKFDTKVIAFDSFKNSILLEIDGALENVSLRVLCCTFYIKDAERPGRHNRH